MVELTPSLQKWLFDHHRDKIALIMFGHLELLTEAMWIEYIEWLKTDEGRQYLSDRSNSEENGNDADAK